MIRKHNNNEERKQFKSVVTIENDTPKNITTQTIDKTNTNSNNEVGSGWSKTILFYFNQYTYSWK